MTRILAITNMYPTASAPTAGTFVEQEVKGVRKIGMQVEVMCIQRTEKGRLGYLTLKYAARKASSFFKPDVVHVMYGGIMADQITQAISNRPVVISFCGTDLLGQPLVGLLKQLSSTYNVWASHRAARRASGIIVKSKNLYDALPADVDRSKVRIIPNGVDLQRFRPMEKKEARKLVG